MKRLITIAALACFTNTGFADGSLEELFNKAIRDAKNVCGVKSFNKGMRQAGSCIEYREAYGEQASPACDSCLLQELAKNNDVEKYINRPVEDLIFNKRHEPKIQNTYEQKLYRWLGFLSASYRANITPYWNDSDEAKTDTIVDLLYSQGDFYSDGRFDGGTTQTVLGQLSMDEYNSEHIQLNTDAGNISALREQVDNDVASIKGEHYQVNKHVDGAHAFVSVVKHSPYHEPLTFLLNTRKGWYTDYVNKSFNRKENKQKRPIIDASIDIQKNNKENPRVYPI